MVLYYIITYPEHRFDPETRWRTDVIAISKSKEILEKFLNEQLDLNKYSLESFELSDTFDTSSKIYVVYYWDIEDPSWACIEFIGKSEEECAAWWADEKWEDFVSYPDDYDIPPTLQEYMEERNITGLSMKTIEIM